MAEGFKAPMPLQRDKRGPELGHIMRSIVCEGVIRYKVSGSFDSLFKILFNFPSRYLFSIGLV